MPGPAWWRQPENRLKKCSERRSDSCADETDGCCAVIACTYCLQWDVYGSEPVYGTADFAADGWYGTIAGAQFAGYWQRNYDTGECEFIVTLDGEEIYRKSCYEGQSCRDSSDSAEATIDYEAGTLTWTRLEPRPLPYVVDDETGCRTWFCGDCECTCRCLCVTITDGYDPTQVCQGELCDTAYSDCEGPVWAGTIACAGTEYVLSLALDRDSYGNCILQPTVNGVLHESIAVDVCTAISGTVTLDDGTTIVVACKECDCNTIPPTTCCNGRELTGPLEVTVDNSLTTCGPQPVISLTQGQDGCWTGGGTVQLPFPAGGEDECQDVTFEFELCCDPAGPVYGLEYRWTHLGITSSWCTAIRDGETCECPYVGLFSHNSLCGGTWNGEVSFVVEEPAGAC